MGGIVTQFPSTYRDISTARLVKAYVAGPERLRHVVGDLGEEELGAKPIAGKWSIREIVLHVADSELVGAVRFRMLLGTGRGAPSLPGYDQDEWSRELAYGHADAGHLAHAMALFAELRATTAKLLSQVAAADWDRSATHPESGMVTLRNLLELYADHSERHVEQILDRRRLLGRSMELPPMLPDRLY